MLGVLHIGNGALPAFTMGGVILSVVNARWVSQNDTWKVQRLFSLSFAILMLGALSHYFWRVSKMGGTPPWVFYVISITIAVYAILSYLVAHRMVGWFAAIRPAGTATLTTYLIPYLFYGFADLTGVVLPDWSTHGLMGIVNCLCFSFVVIGVTWALERLHVKLKI